MLGIARVERYSPDIRALQQRLQNVLEMHQPDATVEVGTQVPGFQAAAQRRQSRIRRLFTTPLQQVRHQQFRQIDLVVHHHLLQIGAGQLALAVQALQGKAAAWPQGLVLTTDQRRIAT
ncbi:hypothetical protein D3C76_1431620 [compost metagenome]